MRTLASFSRWRKVSGDKPVMFLPYAQGEASGLPFVGIVRMSS